MWSNRGDWKVEVVVVVMGGHHPFPLLNRAWETDPRNRKLRFGPEGSEEAMAHTSIPIPFQGSFHIRLFGFYGSSAGTRTAVKPL
ncbi:hypothetical protein E2C01_062300 [Portunus trituberculatus]|uniref:Uncharacterized protein n=1 Tax=Portunus trituberculatus TaxID=210409 RepID=A0A5B7HGY4_PORTR|nr:hypothetical protein [Portunus trituberculatus]